MVADHLPADRARLAAGKACHDGRKGAAHRVQLAVVGFRRLIDAVRRVRFHDHDLRTVLFAVIAGQETGHRAAHGADTGLQEHVGRLDEAHLTRGFERHGRIALHDPGRILRIAFPGRILYHDPAVLFSLRICETHCVVVVQVGDGCVRAGFFDVIESFLCRTVRHVHHALVALLRRGPCDASAVVAVGRGHEGELGIVAGRLVLFDALADAVGSAQRLEGVQAEAVALVLHIKALDAQALRQIRQLGQRGLAVFREGLMERLGLPRLFFGEQLRAA